MVQPSDFTATLSGVTDANGRRAFTVRYDDGVETHERQYVVDVLTDLVIAQTATTEINQLAAEEKAPPLATQIGEPIDLSLAIPPVQQPPTPAQIAEAQYRTDRATLDTLIASQAAGMPIDIQAFTAIKLKTQGEYLPSYDA